MVAPDDRVILEPTPLENFVQTPYIKEITTRALSYIEAGYSVHFRGPAGTGKTTIAKHVANQLARPVVLLHGDEEFSTSNLIGSESGYKTKKVRDNFISSVLKEEQEFQKHWVDNRLTLACRFGFTLIYDEFTRSKPEANNILLSVLEERMMNLPVSRAGEEPYLAVHPNFTGLFTSNPEEYAGVHRSQDALRDRMVTMDLDYFDFETEVGITRAKSGLRKNEAAFIVAIVRKLRDSGKCEFSPTVRGSIMIAKTLKIMKKTPFSDKKNFITICQDILASETSRIGSRTNQNKVKALLLEIIEGTYNAVAK